MAINLGSGAISAAKIGSTDVSKMMLGSTEVYAAGGGGLSDPSTISGLDLWIDASDSSSYTVATGHVVFIDDKSSNALQFAETRNAYYYGSYGAVVNAASQNGLDTLTFDGDSYALASGFIPHIPNFTMFFVAEKSSGTNDYWLGGNASGTRPALLSGYDVSGAGQTQGFEWWGGDGTEVLSFGNASTMTGPQLLTITRSQPGTVTIFLDGTQVASATSNTSLTSSNGFTKFGYGGGAVATAKFCEWLVYDSVLSSSDQQSVEGYLRTRWGL